MRTKLNVQRNQPAGQDTSSEGRLLTIQSRTFLTGNSSVPLLRSRNNTRHVLTGPLPPRRLNLRVPSPLRLPQCPTKVLTLDVDAQRNDEHALPHLHDLAPKVGSERAVADEELLEERGMFLVERLGEGEERREGTRELGGDGGELVAE